MNTTLESRKLQYLQHIEEEYSRKKKWWENSPKYNTTSEIGHQSKAVPDPHDNYAFRFDKQFGSFIFIFLMMVFCGLLKIYSQISSKQLLFAEFLLVVMLLPGIKRAADRQVKLQINATGIFYHKWNGYLSWDMILATFVQTIPDDPDTHKLLVHYYDEENDEFLQQSFVIDCFDVGYTDIAFAIEYCKAKNKLLKQRN
ncbi:hypothetical protein [Foetidibacter luteolus]|uniref:hypothetical protein n=1 Tax=Foetidibacter luteolus TaxID=2608880 RepID=UPI00129A32B8|nr:hypothetical protein [Foetidibacter luteolus]